MQKSPRLDRIDLKILTCLLEDGRISNVNLADAVGLSPSPCLQRVRRLEASGIINAYAAQVSLGKLMETVTVFTEITLTDHRPANFSKFERSMQRIPQVMECHLLSGGYDYLVRFVARSVSHYQEIIENLLDLNIGIAKYFSYVVIKSPIEKKTPPLETLLEESGTAFES